VQPASGDVPVRTGRRLLTLATLLTLLPVAAPPLTAQQDSVTVQAGARYRASPALRVLLGSEYRDLWVAHVRVPVLRADTFAGGLTVLQRGSGLQTASLRFRGADGAEYVFRSVDKDQSGGLPEDLRRTFTSQLLQDQVSSKHPAAALVVAGLLEAVGVPHPVPRLAVLQDHPLLGEHREEFGGMLGTIEERPEDGEDGPGFGGFERVIGTERLLERIEESAGDRVDARAYLRARLVDLLVGDWDRHPDQWRWGQDERDGIRFWIAIPRDRDNAFSHFDGLAAKVGAAIRPNVQPFGPRYSNLYGLVHNAQTLDRRILPLIPAAAWDSITMEVTGRITDEVITAAVLRMPPEYVVIGGPPLESALRARRDELPRVAREFHAMLLTEVDLRGTDEDDRAVIDRRPDGSVEVRLGTGDGHDPYLRRVFLPEETREVRIHLHGGDDRAELRGEGGRITVRVVGGGGDDELRDGSRPLGGARNAFYDHRGENRLVPGRRTVIDRRPYAVEAVVSAVENNAPPPRDWGSGRTIFRPRAAWTSGIGPVIGGGPAWTRYGFRRQPYATESHIAVLASPFHGRAGVEGSFHRVRTGGGGSGWVGVRASQLELTHFHGYGNETIRITDPEIYRVWGTDFSATAGLGFALGHGAEITGATVLRHLRPSPRDAAVAVLPGGEPFSLAGLAFGAQVQRGARPGAADAGFRLTGRLEGYPLVWDEVAEPFVRGDLSASGQLPLGRWLEPTLAMRVSAGAVSRSAPLQYAAFLGGGGSLRGFEHQRFAGRAVTAASAELRTTLTRANLLLARGDLGTIAFLDAGRVFVPHESSSRVHTGYGGGLWFGTLGRALTAHGVVAFGERATLHAGFGLPF
jgi:hypothetical protein